MLAITNAAHIVNYQVRFDQLQPKETIRDSIGGIIRKVTLSWFRATSPYECWRVITRQISRELQWILMMGTSFRFLLELPSTLAWHEHDRLFWTRVEQHLYDVDKTLSYENLRAKASVGDTTFTSQGFSVHSVPHKSLADIITKTRLQALFYDWLQLWVSDPMATL